MPNILRAPERVLGFFNTYRDGKRVTRHTLTEIADQFHQWVTNRSEKWDAPIVEAPQQEWRDDFVLPYLQNGSPPESASISIIGWPCGCARRASLFGNAMTPSCNAPTRNDYKHSPTP